MLQTEIFKYKVPPVLGNARRQLKAHGWPLSVPAEQNVCGGGGVGAFNSCTHLLSAMLRGMFDDSTRKLALTLTDSGQFVGCYAVHFARSYAHYYKKSNSLIRLQATRFWLCVRRDGNVADNENISCIMEQLQLNAEIGRKIQRLQQHTRRQNATWLRRYDEASTSDVASTCMLGALSAFNSKKLAACKKLCSAGVIIEWIDQQRENMQALAAEDGDIQSPILLDLSYHNSDASGDVPILLLDNTIQLNSSSVSEYQEHSDYVSRTAATVMVSAIRTAAELELPVNIIAVMKLTRPKVELALPRLNFGTSEADCMLLVNLRYEPKSICDVQSFGTAATISLIFNAQFPIWRHYHHKRDVADGKLDPLWFLLPQQKIKSMAHNVAHADYSGKDLQNLISLAAYNIVPHLLWHSRHGNQTFRTTVRFHRVAIPK